MTHRPNRHLRVRRSLAGAAAAAVVLAGGLAACGSQVDPSTLGGATGTLTTNANGQPVDAAGLPVDAGGVPSGGTGVTLGSDGLPGGDVNAPLGSGGLPESGSDSGPGTGGSDGSTNPAGPQTDPTDPTAPGADPTGGDNAPTGNGPQAACDGFKNQTGITDDKISLGNVADLTGAVPGLFEAAQQGAAAYVDYFNASNDICGRKLDLDRLDSKGDAGADQQAYTTACDKDFAVVGSVSAQDQGGAATAAGCGIPDIRSFTVTPDRRNCATCFSTAALSPNLVPDALPKYWLKKDKDAVQRAAILYVNVAASATTAQSFAKAYTTAGWKIPVLDPIDQTTFDYSPYVQKMKSDDVDMVIYFGPYQFTERLLSAMQQAGFDPKYFMQDATIYDQKFVDEASDLADGSYVYTTQEPFEKTSIPEMALYESYLQQVAPGASPTTYGLYAWSATRLFVEQAAALGGKLTRASLVAALAKVKDWTGNGLHTSQEVGAKITPKCIKVLQLKDGRFSQVSPGDFMCGGLVDSGVGG